MNIAPTRVKGLIINGLFSFSAKLVNDVDISDSYHLKIIIPDTFPKSVPLVIELENKIHRDGKHHINPNDTLCLGSPLRLKFILSKNPSLVGFTERILVPYLYAISHQKIFKGKLPADELAHGVEGIVNDYSELLGLNTTKQIKAALLILGTKKRLANKKPCPCNCGKLYSKCEYKKVLEKYRCLANRSWFRNHSKNLGVEYA